MIQHLTPNDAASRQQQQLIAPNLSSDDEHCLFRISSSFLFVILFQKEFVSKKYSHEMRKVFRFTSTPTIRLEHSSHLFGAIKNERKESNRAGKRDAKNSEPNEMTTRTHYRRMLANSDQKQKAKRRHSTSNGRAHDTKLLFEAMQNETFHIISTHTHTRERAHGKYILLTRIKWH